MRLFYLLLLLPVLATANTDTTLQTPLLQMANLDQSIRNELVQMGWENASETLKAKLISVDKENTQTLKAMLKERQWFTKSEVGQAGIDAAFLIVQHSPDHEFQSSMLPKLKASYLNNEGVSGQDVALLTDRVHIHNGGKQRYGTQADLKDNKIVFMPIENAETVDKRRAEMNLPPLAIYKKMMEEVCGIKDHPEINLD